VAAARSPRSGPCERGRAGRCHGVDSLGTVVSTNPANFTPNVASGTVYKFVQLNGVMYAGGSFSSLSTATGVSPSGTFTRHNLVAFNPPSA
jgi:hypothetical protein